MLKLTNLEVHPDEEKRGAAFIAIPSIPVVSLALVAMAIVMVLIAEVLPAQEPADPTEALCAHVAAMALICEDVAPPGGAFDVLADEPEVHTSTPEEPSWEDWYPLADPITYQKLETTFSVTLDPTVFLPREEGGRRVYLFAWLTTRQKPRAERWWETFAYLQVLEIQLKDGTWGVFLQLGSLRGPKEGEPPRAVQIKRRKRLKAGLPDGTYAFALTALQHQVSVVMVHPDGEETKITTPTPDGSPLELRAPFFRVGHKGDEKGDEEPWGPGVTTADLMMVGFPVGGSVKLAVHWENRETGEHGHGEPLSATIAIEWAKKANQERPDYRHWTEPLAAAALTSSFAISPTAKILAAGGSPVTLPPRELWGGLEPRGVLVDSTGVIGEPGDAPHPHQGAVAGGRLVFATGQGYVAFDVSDAARPRYLGYGDASFRAPSWFHSDLDFFMNTVAMASPEVAVTGAGSQGLVIWDVDRFLVHYQDAGRTAGGVVAVSHSSGRDYAIVSTPDGPALYDLAAAADLHRCLDDGTDSCGVFRGILPGGGAVAHAAGELFVTMDGPTGVRLYELDPNGFASLTPLLAGTLLGSHGMAVLYRRGERLYLVALGSRFDSRMRSFVWIYDVTGAGALPSPLAEYEVTDRMRTMNRQVFLSLVGERFLYVGNVNVGLPGQSGTACVDQREHLLDLDLFDPAAPAALAELDLFPPRYGRHYYQECPGGFRGTMPRLATGKDGVLYRSAWSFADSHRIVPRPPALTDLIFEDGFESGDTSKWDR